MALLTLTAFFSWQCDSEEVAPDNQGGNDQAGVPGIITGSPRFSGDLNALFVGHSAVNDRVAEYVVTLAELRNTRNSIASEVVLGTDISLRGKMDMPEIRSFMQPNSTHDYDFAVITEQWDMQNYNVDIDGVDNNDPVAGCPSDNYQVPGEWTTDEWAPIPYFIQQYRDGLKCGNAATHVFYYQTWSLGYNEVENGASRPSDQNYQRPTVEEVQQAIRSGEYAPDLPLADRIDFEGVKWQNLLRHTNREDIIFIPAGFALARLIRDIEAGVVPGFEAVAATHGADATGRLVWTDYLFYEDQYHLSTVGNYLMSLVIYASVFNESPEGIEIGNDNFPASEFFPDDQYPLTEISNEEYANLLSTENADGIYDLRGVDGRDYMHEDLRNYLQRLAWEVVQEDSSY
jgi:hypothetical protein